MSTIGTEQTMNNRGMFGYRKPCGNQLDGLQLWTSNRWRETNKEVIGNSLTGVNESSFLHFSFLSPKAVISSGFWQGYLKYLTSSPGKMLPWKERVGYLGSLHQKDTKGLALRKVQAGKRH